MKTLISNLIYQIDEEQLISDKPLTYNKKKYLDILIKYRINILSIHYFNFLSRYITANNNQILKNPEFKKEIIVCFNDRTQEINNKLFKKYFPKISIDNLKKESNISFPTQKNLFTFTEQLLTYDTETIDENKNYYKLNGLLCFIVFNITKTTQKLKILIFSNEIHQKKRQTKDIATYIQLKHPLLYQEILTFIQIHLKNELFNIGVNSNWFKEEEYNDNIKHFFFGFIGSLTLNTNNENDILDVLELLYEQTNKSDSLLLNLYYKVFQFKSSVSKYEIDVLDKTQVNFFTKLKYCHAISSSKTLINFPVLSLKDNKLSLTFPNVKTYFFCKQNYLQIKARPPLENQTLLPLDTKNKNINQLAIPLVGFKSNRSHSLLKFISFKEILYQGISIGIEKNLNTNNILYNKLYVINNCLYINPILLSQENIDNNFLIHEIKKKYFITHNQILKERNNNIILTDNQQIYNLIHILIKIAPNEIKWSNFLDFYHSLESSNPIFKNDNVYQIFIDLLDLLKNTNAKLSDSICTTLIFEPLSSVFTYLYSEEQISELLNIYRNNFIICEDTFSIKDKSSIEQISLDEQIKIDQYKEKFNDFFEAFSCILLLIKKHETMLLNV